MARKTGKGRISFRGILALAIGLVWVWFALNPEGYGNDNTPPFPLLIRAILLVGGVALIYGGISSLRFVWKRSGLIGSQPSVPAEICVLEDDDDDRGTETVHVRIAGRCQALDVERSGKVRKYVDGKVRRGEVWLNQNGMVQAIAISGEHFNTLDVGRAIPEDGFGKSGS
ncbi:MAG: hypothetical protein ACK5WH_12475 [Hyphomonadaceae bacterium]